MNPGKSHPCSCPTAGNLRGQASHSRQNLAKIKHIAWAEQELAPALVSCPLLMKTLCVSLNWFFQAGESL